jgi:hypothetical protein
LLTALQRLAAPSSILAKYPDSTAAGKGMTYWPCRLWQTDLVWRPTGRPAELSNGVICSALSPGVASPNLGQKGSTKVVPIYLLNSWPAGPRPPCSSGEPRFQCQSAHAW